MALGVYIHVPFCLRKCPYCDFASVPFDDALAEAYTVALCMEIRQGASTAESVGSVRTVYLGGGTPTVLGLTRLAAIIECVRTFHSVPTDAEVTVEANPGALTGELVEGLLAAGVNRLSIGVQSFHAETLAALGRAHSADEGVQAVAHASRAPRWSLDLMFGVMGQTLDQAVRDVQLALATGAAHVSAYCLTVEDGTPLHIRVARGEVSLPDPGLQRAMFDAVGDTLEAGGLARYEISNFARAGHESRHNLGYWLGHSYVGYGASAHSYLGGVRWWNVPDPAEYVRRVESGLRPEAGRETETPRTRYLETLMLRLRTRHGVPYGDVQQLANEAGERSFPDRVAAQEALGLLECSNGWLRLTREGLPFADSVIHALA